jgi:hypothetical protein
MSVREQKTTNLEICLGRDMEIVLPSSSGNDTYRYTVTSYQLYACSSIFRAMLGPKLCGSDAAMG